MAHGPPMLEQQVPSRTPPEQTLVVLLQQLAEFPAHSPPGALQPHMPFVHTLLQHSAALVQAPPVPVQQRPPAQLVVQQSTGAEHAPPEGMQQRGAFGYGPPQARPGQHSAAVVQLAISPEQQRLAEPQERPEQQGVVVALQASSRVAQQRPPWQERPEQHSA